MARVAEILQSNRRSRMGTESQPQLHGWMYLLLGSDAAYDLGRCKKLGMNVSVIQQSGKSPLYAVLPVENACLDDRPLRWLYRRELRVVGSCGSHMGPSLRFVGFGGVIRLML